MFHPTNEEDDLFTTPNSSNLASIFGQNIPTNSGNTDLIYSAPRQPKPIVPQQKLEKPKPQNNVIFAKVVRVFKTVNNSYTIIGKYGLAIVDNSTKSKEIMLYKDKQNILAKSTVSSNFQIQIENDIVSFCDNKSDNWHVQFDDGEHLKEFLEEMKKVNVKIVEVFKENVDDNHSVNITSTTDNSIKSDGNESDDSVSQSRAHILSRMAKMGQAILPGNILKNPIEDNHMSSSPNTTTRNLSENNVRIPEHTKEPLNHDSSVNDSTNQITNKNRHSTPTRAALVSPYIPVYPSQCLPNPSIINTVMPPQDFNLFISENRIQNSEVRINLMNITSKLDNVMDEITKIKEPPNTDRLENEFLKSKITDLERNIGVLTQKLAEANNSNKIFQLESLINSKDQQIKEQDERIKHLENILKKNEGLQNIIDDLTSKEIDLQNTIQDLKLQLQNSEYLSDEHQTRIGKLTETNQILLKDIDDLKKTIKLLEEQAKSVQKVVNNQEELDHKIKIFADTIKDSMNLMFQNMISKFDQDRSSYQYAEIRNVLSSNIKQTTFKIIQRYQDLLQSSEDVNEATNHESISC